MVEYGVLRTKYLGVSVCLRAEHVFASSGHNAFMDALRTRHGHCNQSLAANHGARSLDASKIPQRDWSPAYPVNVTCHCNSNVGSITCCCLDRYMTGFNADELPWSVYGITKASKMPRWVHLHRGIWPTEAWTYLDRHVR